MQGLIFDFDGVIADSEALANTVLAETVTVHGLPTTLEQALNRYMGKRWPEVIAAIEMGLGRVLPTAFSDDLQRATLDRFRSDLREVTGASLPAASLAAAAAWRLAAAPSGSGSLASGARVAR